MMYRYTTPTITISIPNSLPVGDITSLVVVLMQDGRKMEKTLTDVSLDGSGNTIVLTLSQEETGALETGTVKIQCHILVGDTAYATNEMILPVYRNLHNEVIV